MCVDATQRPGTWAQADTAMMGNRGRWAEPHLPPGIPGAGAPVDAFPVQHEALVLESDLVDCTPAYEVARLGTVPDRPLLVVGPVVPPHTGTGARADALGQPASEQRLHGGWQVPGRGLKPAIGVQQLRNAERRSVSAGEQVEQGIDRAWRVHDVRVGDQHERGL